MRMMLSNYDESFYDVIVWQPIEILQGLLAFQQSFTYFYRNIIEIYYNRKLIILYKILWTYSPNHELEIVNYSCHLIGIKNKKGEMI